MKVKEKIFNKHAADKKERDNDLKKDISKKDLDIVICALKIAALEEKVRKMNK